jgi:hypothetical protein
MNPGLSALVLASAVELSGGMMLEDGYRPGARVGLAWPIAKSEHEGKNGRSAVHRLAAGPDLGTYVVPSYQWAVLPGGTIGYRRIAKKGFRLEADVGLAVGFHKYLIPTYVIEDGELDTVAMAGRARLAPNTRLGIGFSPTEDRSWGAVFRPSAYFERPVNGLWAPVLTAEVAGIWRL